MSSATEPARAKAVVSTRLAVILLGVVGYESLAHWITVSDTVPWLSGPLALVPLALICGWVIWRRRNVLDCLVLGGAVLTVLALEKWVSAGAMRAFPHVTVSLFVGSLFGRTLLPGYTPLLTQLARHVHGTLPAVLVRYTRQVTWIWFLFMTALALTSLLLSCLAAPSLWSWFANVLTLPLVILLFALEYVYRLRRFPWFQHASPLDAIRVFRKLSVRDTQL